MHERSSHFIQAQECLSQAKDLELTLEGLRDLSVRLASLMLQEANQTQTSKEKKQQKQLALMVSDAHGKVFTSSMADQCFRSTDPYRVADQLVYLIRKFGIPSYLSWWKKLQLQMFSLMGKPFAPLIVPVVTWALRRETAAVILPGEGDRLNRHLKHRHAQGIRMNLNHLGEAILGETEAEHRLQVYLEDLENPEIEYVSIKISTIYSQINLLAWDATLEVLAERLRKLYRAARRNTHVRADGKKVEKFVNLDMEEYRDLHLTVALFKKVLDEEEFKDFEAGIVLQAYLPDSYEIQKSLTTWAIERCRQGGAPIKIRIVKGANLAMEAFEASVRGWPQAPYRNKVDVDANYKRMVLFGMEKKHAQAVHLGIGSHNLFDIAFAMLLRARHGVQDEVCFEMLEGMAGHLSRVVQALSGGMLLYCPAAKRHEFQNAVAYLIRRLDENTAKDNFLRHSFHLQEGSKAWKQQVELFRQAFAHISSARNAPYREQDRRAAPVAPSLRSPFANEPDTDFSLPANQEWARSIIQKTCAQQISPIPLVINGEVMKGAEEGKGVDPSSPDRTCYTYAMASLDQVETALQAADLAVKRGDTLSVTNWSEIMAKVAQKMREARGDLIAAMIIDGGKTVLEADVEVSEAIDMAEYYRRSREELASFCDLQWKPKGVAVVVPPWNFPCAIPAGGVIAALLAGNSVIFKPSRDTVLVAWRVVNLLWDAGVPKSLLQFVTGSSSVIGDKLISDPRVKLVILTGSTDTGKKMLELRPNLHLMAETGGKNAIIVTKLADQDLAIKETVHSAFGHAGQKCSAASLLILEKEVYDNLHFRQQLRDAAASLIVGSPWNLSTKVGPLIHAPNRELMRGLTTLEEGESWLLKPRQLENNPNLWTPGIKWGVKPGSFCHQTELFGPVLSVMCAKNLSEAIKLANGGRYGLTGGIHSLDERELKIWMKEIEVGNCYVNRSITGAIVRRQPFGGCKASCIGPGAKAGGPNYIVHMMDVTQVASPTDRAALHPALSGLKAYLKEKKEVVSLWEQAAESYSFWAAKYHQDEDPSQIVGQDNLLRYVPQKRIVFRLQAGDALIDAAQVLAAAVVCGTSFEVSYSKAESPHWASDKWPVLLGITWIEESEQVLMTRIQKGEVRRLRVLSVPSQSLQKACAEALLYVAQGKPLANGRIELLNYLREVAISIDYHRYGNLGERENQ